MAVKKLKSIHITNYYHKNSGGISTAYDRLLEAANRHRRFVRLIVPGAEHAQEEIGEFGRIYYVKAKPAPVFDKRYRLILPFDYLPGGSPVRKILEDERPDIIEIGEKYTLSLLAGVLRRGRFKKLDRPLLVHFSCERMDDNLRAFVSGTKPFQWFSRRLIGNYIYPMFDFHLANSEYTAQEVKDSVSAERNPHRSKSFFDFCQRFFRAPRIESAERVFVNQCGADSHLFSFKRKAAKTRQTILAEAGFPANATVLLYAGRLSPEKNVDFLPAVFRSLLDYHNLDSQKREYRLLIAGDGPSKNLLEERLERLAPGKFKFLGHITGHDKLADLYANSDIFLHPNPREPFGIGPLEAMASGLPVVAPNSGGVLSYANDENSWLSEPHVEGFFTAVRDVFNDEEKRLRKIENAIATAKKYSWENSTDNLFALYDKMYDDFQRRHDLFVPEKEGNPPSLSGKFAVETGKNAGRGLE